MIKSIYKSGFYAILGKYIIALNALIYIILSGRILSQAEFGILMLAIVFLNFYTLINDIGIGSSIIKHATGRDTDQFSAVIVNSLFIQFVFTTIFSLLLFVFAGPLSILFKSEDLLLIFKILPLLLFSLMFTNFSKQILQAKQNFRGMCIIDLSALIFLIITFGHLAIKNELDSAFKVVSLLTLSYSFSAFVGIVLTKDLVKKSKINKILIGKILQFAKYTSFSAFGTAVSTRIDTLLLGYFFTTSTVAFYNSSWAVANGLFMISLASYAVIFPLSSKLSYERESDKIRDVFEKGINYTLKLVIPITVLTILFSNKILNFIYGGKYVGAESILIILSTWAIIRVFGNISGAVINGMGEPNVVTSITWMITVTTILFNIVLIPSYGPLGAAIATVSASFLGTSVGLIWLKRRINFSFIRLIRLGRF